MSIQRVNRSELPWQAADIAFHRIDRSRVRDDETLFFVLASASLIESGSDLYTDVLNEHFAADPSLVRWLAEHWQYEELQHGAALRTYVEYVWPEFDWQAAYRQFIAEYALYCSLAQLEPTPMLELAARCIVETGTASLYRALHDYTDEPVLKDLTARIRADEVRHYKKFYCYFSAHNDGPGRSRWRVLRTLAHRLLEIHSEDASCALRHVFQVRYPERGLDSESFRVISNAARRLVIDNMARRTMVKMAIKPLYLPPRLQNFLVPPVAKIVQYVFSSS